jgi:hypothetical protein
MRAARKAKATAKTRAREIPRRPEDGLCRDDSAEAKDRVK